METSQLMLIELVPLILCCVLDILREPFAELIMRVEKRGHDEMKKGPEFLNEISSR